MDNSLAPYHNNVDSLRILATKNISNSIALAAQKSIPLSQARATYLDPLPSDYSYEIKQNFIYTEGIKQKLDFVDISQAHTAGVSALAENNDHIYSSSEDRDIKIWDKKTGAYVSKLIGHTDPIYSMDLHKNTNIIYSGSHGTIKTWQLNINSCVNTTILPTKSIVWAIKHSQTENKLYTALSDHTIKIWDTANSKHVTTLDGHAGPVISLFENNNLLYSGSNDGTVKIWDPRTKKGINFIKISNDQARCLIILGNKQKIFVGGNHDIKSWDLRTNQPIDTYTGHTKYIFCLTPSKNGNCFYSGSRDDTIKIWDVNSNACINTMNAHNHAVWSIIESSNSNHIYSGSEDKSIKLWSLPSFKSAYNQLTLAKDL